MTAARNKQKKEKKMSEYVQLLNKVKSEDRVIVRSCVDGLIVADDVAENLLDKSKYYQDNDVFTIGVENGHLLLEVF